MPTARTRPRKRWWQRLLRLGVLLALAAGGAYATLPWWLPREWLREILSRRLSRAAGVAVSIQDLALGWEEGLVLHNLIVAGPGGPEGNVLASVETLRADFSPIDLARGRLAWMELEHPRLFLQVDGNGEADLAPLAGLLRSDIRTQRISLRQALLELRLPHLPAPLVLEVADAQVQAGRIYPVGKATLTAGLEQAGGLVPISLRFAEGPQEEGLHGTALLTFGGLDLAPLQLPFYLPLRRLGGLCSGEVELAVTTEGRVNQFKLNIEVRGLDMQPRGGQDLPVFDRAFLQMEGGFDPFRGLDLRSAHVRLPGMDLRGRAAVRLDPRGHWDRLSLVDFAGTVQPRQLAALVKGGEAPGDLLMDGPVQVALHAQEPPDNPQGASRAPPLALEANILATDAEVRRGRDVLKPPGRRLEVWLAGRLDGEDWSYSSSGDQVVRLGENLFRGAGTVSNLRRLTERWSDPNRAWGARDVLEDLAHFRWNGSWEVRDLPSLADLWPAVGGAMKAVRLDGELAGEIYIGQKDGNEVVLRAALPAGSRLVVPGCFATPAGLETRLALTARIDASGSGWRDVDLLAGAGDASLHIRGGSAAFVEEGKGAPSTRSAAPADASPPVVSAQGRWQLQGVESAVKCLDFPLPAGLVLAGTMEGSGSLCAGPAGAEGWLDIRADLAAAGWGEFWRKPAGEPASCQVRFAAGRAGGDWALCALSAEVHGPRADLALEANLAGGGPAGLAGISGKIRAEVKDANWALESSPLLAKAMEGGRLRGPLRLDAAGAWTRLGAEANLRLRPDGQDLALPGGRLVKPPGMALDWQVAARYRREQAERPEGDVQASGRLTVGTCDLHYGAVQFDWPPAGRPRRIQDLPGMLPGFSASLAVEIDEGLAEVLPALGPGLRRHGIGGKARGQWVMHAGGESISAWGRADLTDLRVAGAGPFVKPAGMPAGWEMSLSVPSDLSRVEWERCTAYLGEANLAARGAAKMAISPDGAVRLWDEEANVALAVADVAELARCVPALAEYEARGEARLQARWSGPGGPSVPWAQFRTAGLSGVYRGRRVSLAGDLRAEGVSWPPAPASTPADANGASAGGFAIARLATDGLEFRAGENHAWLVADLAGLPHGLAGRVRVLAEALDDKDLSDWLGEPNAPRPAGRLANGEAKALEERGDRLIASARRLLEGGELDFRCEIDRFRTYDPQVAQTYEVHQMVLQAGAGRDRLQVRMAGGVGGGTFRRDLQADLKAAAPALSTETAYVDVLASDSTRAQASRLFPGNTVYGSFQYHERLSMPLRSAVANLLDPRSPLRASGSGLTTATSGLLEGRAAPQFVTAIFPGLNTSKYRYHRMKAFTNILPDGTVEGDTIFSGESYDMYMEGSTDPNHIARYELGLILLSSPQSPEFNHDLKLGRIPILKIKARVEGGQLHDTEVSYPWPNQTLGTILIRNNPFYRIWVTLRKK